MVKTRSRSAKIPLIKNEEEEDSITEIKHDQLLNGVSTTTKATGKISKKTSTRSENKTSLFVSDIKLEEDSDGKVLLQDLKIKRKRHITEEQLTRLIHYIEHDKMTVPAAANKANMNSGSGYRYYYRYIHDPERKIPRPLNGKPKNDKPLAPEQIKKLMDYTLNDKLSVVAASTKLNISVEIGRIYYDMYTQDIERKIPSPRKPDEYGNIRYTQEQIESFIGYVVNGKMSVLGASLKANIGISTGRRCYQLYKDDPENRIPEAYKKMTIGSNKPYTHEKINSLINYIVNYNMTVSAAAKKSDMNVNTAYKYYNKYKKDPEHKIPIPLKGNMDQNNPLTQAQIESLINYITNDKMTIFQAAIKVKMSEKSARSYYRLYLEDPERNIPLPRTRCNPARSLCTHDQVKSLIISIVKDGLSITEASKRANMDRSTGVRYYNKYMEDPDHNIPVPNHRISGLNKRCTDETIKAFIDCVIKEKMPISAASRKVKIARSTGRKYYAMYMQDPDRKIPTSSEKKIIHRKHYSQELMSRLVEYIEKDEMTVAEASKKVGVSLKAANRYYSKYRKNLNHEIHYPKYRHRITSGRHRCTGRRHPQNRITELIDYIIKDKMTIVAASKKSKIPQSTAGRYYRQYLKDIKSQTAVKGS